MRVLAPFQVLKSTVSGVQACMGGEAPRQRYLSELRGYNVN